MAWKWIDFGLNNRIAIHADTWTGNGSTSTNALADTTMQLVSIKIHYDSPVYNNATVTIKSPKGINYDTVITTFNNTAGATDNSAYYDEGEVLEPGDIIKVACDVTTNNAYCTIKAKMI